MESIAVNKPLSNVPLFPVERRNGGYQEVWYLKLNNPDAVQALWLRFTILIREDKTKEAAEVWAIFFNKVDGKTRKIGLKNTYPLASFTSPGPTGLCIADNCLLEDRTQGCVKNESTRIAWDLSFAAESSLQHDFVPKSLRRLGLVKNTALTIHERLLFSGWCEVNGERFTWDQAPGMQGHLAGPKNGHSWVWGHCNCFCDENGTPAPVIWDGLSARARLGNHAAPPLTSMYFQMDRHAFAINTVADALRSRSVYDFDGWHFITVKRGYKFEGDLTSRLDDFACVTYEDTDGSSLYCHNAKICDMTLEVTDPDGRKNRYVSTRAAAYELVARQKHPNIPVII